MGRRDDWIGRGRTYFECEIGAFVACALCADSARVHTFCVRVDGRHGEDERLLNCI
jgi:hypothetical protein